MRPRRQRLRPFRIKTLQPFPPAVVLEEQLRQLSQNNGIPIMKGNLPQEARFPSPPGGPGAYPPGERARGHQGYREAPRGPHGHGRCQHLPLLRRRGEGPGVGGLGPQRAGSGGPAPEDDPGHGGGNSLFTPPRPQIVEGREVFFSQGQGAYHYYYRKGDRIIWVQIEARDPQLLLQEALKIF